DRAVRAPDHRGRREPVSPLRLVRRDRHSGPLSALPRAAAPAPHDARAMSRYVSVDLSLALPTGHDALRDLLETLGLSVVPGPVSLTGSLECQGEPVDLKIDPGPYGTIEDFGFVLQPRARLVCGELDKR